MCKELAELLIKGVQRDFHMARIRFSSSMSNKNIKLPGTSREDRTILVQPKLNNCEE